MQPPRSRNSHRSILGDIYLNCYMFQDDADLAMQAIPELAKLLNPKNSEILVSVTTCIHQVLYTEDMCNICVHVCNICACVCSNT